MRRELMRKANLGARIADEANQQDSWCQAHGARPAPGNSFPRPIRQVHSRFMHRRFPLRWGTSLLLDFASHCEAKMPS
jgi:hypothetical protein